VPQAMAYAMLAGLPPIVGLYASVLPVAAYALLGTSRQLAVGPVAMVSLMVASSVGLLAEVGTEAYLGYAVLLAGLVGVIQFGMGTLKLGFLVNLLSHPVISGFTSAAALIIGLSQLKHLMGVEIARSHHIHEILLAAVEQSGETHLPTLALGLGGIFILVGLKRWNPRIPGALAVVVLGTLAVKLFGLDDAGVKTVGEVPAGLPGMSLPPMDPSSIHALLPAAIAISLVGFMESFSVASSFASRDGHKLNANRELMGLGAANLVGTLFGAYPVTGGFSRTAVNAQAGAKTPLAGLITAGMVAITLVFFTPLFHDLPKPVLASIVMVAVFGLINVKEALQLTRIKRTDAFALGATFFGTLTLGIELGILTGVVLSLAFFLKRAATPHHVVLGQMPDGCEWKSLARNPEARPPTGIRVLRVDASLYFANADFVVARAIELTAGDEPIHAIVLDLSAVNDVDSSAAHALETLHDDLAKVGIRFALANPKGPVRDMLARSGVTAHFGPKGTFSSIKEAVTALEDPQLATAS